MIVSVADMRKLRALIESLPPDARGNASELETKLKKVRVVGADAWRGDVVTLESAVVMRDVASGAHHYFVLRLESGGERAGAEVLVLEPLGLALLGRRIGEVIEWSPRDSRRRLRIEAVQQPIAIRNELTSIVTGDPVYA